MPTEVEKGNEKKGGVATLFTPKRNARTLMR